MIFVESVPAHLKGYLDRYLSELRSGMYVGALTSDVASRLWETVQEFSGEGDAIMIRASLGAAGYEASTKDNPRWFMHDFDGFELACRTSRERKRPYMQTLKAPQTIESDARRS